MSHAKRDNGAKINIKSSLVYIRCLGYVRPVDRENQKEKGEKMKTLTTKTEGQKHYTACRKCGKLLTIGEPCLDCQAERLEMRRKNRFNR